jgi:hypothetical protein
MDDKSERPGGQAGATICDEQKHVGDKENSTTAGAARKPAQVPKPVLLTYLGDAAWLVDFGNRFKIINEADLLHRLRAGEYVCVCEDCRRRLQ